jgi:hypothetical protein
MLKGTRSAAHEKKIMLKGTQPAPWRVWRQQRVVGNQIVWLPCPEARYASGYQWCFLGQLINYGSMSL